MQKAYELCFSSNGRVFVCLQYQKAFSALKYVKNYLRKTMSNERLEAELHLFIEKDNTDEIILKHIIHKDRQSKKRRYKLCIKYEYVILPICNFDLSNFYRKILINQIFLRKRFFLLSLSYYHYM